MTPLARPSRLLVTGLASALVLGAAACSGDDDDKKSDPTPTPTASGSATPTSAPAKPAVDPLNGGPLNRRGVVAVKIDDTAPGRPQRNIDKADIVYIEEVEGGLTRLVGVFHTKLPVVESVRSTRPADPELVSQYGPIAYVASGGARVPLRILDRSYLKTTINDRGGPGFERADNRSAPYNLTADLGLIARRLKAPRAKNVGFAWATSTAQLKGAAAGTRVTTMVGGTPVEFRYNARTQRYIRFIDGVAQRTQGGQLVSTSNVIVQFCKVEPFPGDTDVNGNPNQFTHTIGSGKAVVFRNGKRLSGTWKRTSLRTGTAFVSSRGTKLALRPGGAWVVLTKNGTRLG